MHGHGRKIYEIGLVYIGFWNNNLYEGAGHLTQINGDIYEGEFKEGEYHGEGT